MTTVYVREQGAVVRRRGERLLVTHNKQELFDLPIIHVDQVVIFGNAQLTTPAAAMLLQAEIDVVFLSVYGKFRGRLIHTGSKFAQLRHAQLQKMSSESQNLAIASQVVAGKLHNQRTLLEARLADAAASIIPVQRAVSGMQPLQEKAIRAVALDSLRGFEGSGGAIYWGAFRHLLKGTELKFEGRKFYPPPDPVNALLSFGYSLLLKDVTAAVQLVGLDPFLGFFHTIDYGRPSLALDMMEEFRPVLVDGLVLDLINSRQITPPSFEKTADPKLPVRLAEPALDIVIQAYEQQLNQRVYHADADGQTTRRRIIELQVRRLAAVVLDRVKKYHPFMVQQ